MGRHFLSLFHSSIFIFTHPILSLKLSSSHFSLKTSSSSSSSSSFFLHHHHQNPSLSPSKTSSLGLWRQDLNTTTIILRRTQELLLPPCKSPPPSSKEESSSSSSFPSRMPFSSLGSDVYFFLFVTQEA